VAVVVIVEVGMELLVAEGELLAEDVVLSRDTLLVEEGRAELVDDRLLDEDDSLLDEDDELLDEDDELVDPSVVQVVSRITVNVPESKVIVLGRSWPPNRVHFLAISPLKIAYSQLEWCLQAAAHCTMSRLYICDSCGLSLGSRDLTQMAYPSIDWISGAS
jgi:hypothetical protein